MNDRQMPMVGQQFRLNPPCKAPLTPEGWGNTLIGTLGLFDYLSIIIIISTLQ